jgi:hypothetical protein
VAVQVVRVVQQVVARPGLAVASAAVQSTSTTDQVERRRWMEWEVGVGKKEQMEVEASEEGRMAMKRCWIASTSDGRAISVRVVWQVVERRVVVVVAIETAGHPRPQPRPRLHPRRSVAARSTVHPHRSATTPPSHPD